MVKLRSLLVALAMAALASCSSAGDGSVWSPWPGRTPPPPTDPVLSGLTPTSATAGDPDFVLTVSGTGFESGAVVTWKGEVRPTTFISSTTLEATIAAADVTSAGFASVGGTNPGGAYFGALQFTIAAVHPTISSLSPSSVTAGDPAFVLTVTGTKFRNGAVVTWNFAALPTTFVSSTTLEATISAADVADAASVFVGVTLPVGDSSFFETFTVRNPIPTISSLSPSSITMGSGDLILTVNGGPFVSGSHVEWNGGWRPTVFVSSSVLRAEIAESDLAAYGGGSVTASNPEPGGGVSAAVALPIGRPIPAPTAMSPASAAPGAPRFTLTVMGSGFAPDTVVRWNGAARPTTVVSTTVLHASIAAADVASTGTAEVSVHSPPPDGGTAVAGRFTIAPIPARAPQAVAFQLDPAHSGGIDLGAALTLAVDPAWVVTLADAASYPLIAGGKAFLLSRGTSTGGWGAQLHALDLASGASAWGPVDIPGGYSWAAHAYDAGTVFVISSYGVLRAFDAATGTPGWTVDLPGQYSFSSPPTATGGAVYVTGAGSGATLYAVDGSDGALRWTAPVTHASPAVALDGVFVSEGCVAYKLDLLTGSRIWSHGGPCSTFWGGRIAAYASSGLYVRTASTRYDPMVTIFDPFDGTSIATFGPPPPSVAIPAIGASASFLVALGTLEARDLAGKWRWSFDAGGTLTSAPIAVGGAVFVGSSTGTLHAIDAATGTEVWTGDAGAPVPPPDEVTSGQPLTGLGAGEGYLLVPAGRRITAWRLVPP